MSEPFIAEIRMVGFNFAPKNWSFCDGQLLPINQNMSLFSLLGTNYGGDGRTSFALPDLRGRTPVHWADYHPLGQKSGQETVTLTSNEMPHHSHYVKATSTEGTESNVGSTVRLADSTEGDIAYSEYQASQATHLQAGTASFTGGGLPHNNMQPYLALSFCIALQGLFPSRN